MNKAIYITPTIENFSEGTIYEQIPTFTDGTVKSQKEFDNGVWEKRVFTKGDRPYINRALTGRNAENGRCGIRMEVLVDRTTTMGT